MNVCRKFYLHMTLYDIGFSPLGHSHGCYFALPLPAVMSMTTTPLPPLPPPPPPAPTVPHPTRPNVASEGPPGALQLELLIHDGYPFKDHWAFRVRSHENNDVGVVFHATGDVRNGFIFEIKRNFDFRRDLPIPSQIIPLQWIDKENFDEGPMFAGDIGVASFDYEPLATSAFEVSLYKVNPPGKSLNTVSNSVSPRFSIRDSAS